MGEGGHPAPYTRLGISMTYLEHEILYCLCGGIAGSVLAYIIRRVKNRGKA